MAALVETKGNIVFIVLSGQLDYSSQDDIHTAINTALAGNSSKEIRVDLKDVAFLDSSIIQALLNLQMKASRVHKSVLLIHCPELIKEIFSIGGFDGVLKIQ